MKKSNFYIYNQPFLNPLLRGLRESGASLERLTSKSNIKMFNYESLDAYLPMSIVYEFFKNIKGDQVVNNMAAAFYKDFEISDLGEYGKFLTECPDLLTVLLEGIKNNYLFQTNSIMNLEVLGATARFTNIHLESESEESRIAERIELAMILNAFWMILGKDWIPLKIEIKDDTAEWLDDILPVDKINIQRKSPYYALVFETERLLQKNKSKTKELIPLSSFPTNLTDKIYHLLFSFKDGNIPMLSDFSNFFNVSERTLIRCLHTEGTKYSSLVQRCLFSKSLKLLSNNNLTVLETSQKLGYSNAPNFIRAFKKWTNTSPNAYRLQKFHLVL